MDKQKRKTGKYLQIKSKNVFLVSIATPARLIKPE